ncbi:hypothetical protein M5689_015192 [Euphorbia peplus]|nr:hypothetical protein M5689_015192 [Euphorbia peplus]
MSNSTQPLQPLPPGLHLLASITMESLQPPPSRKLMTRLRVVQKNPEEPKSDGTVKDSKEKSNWPKESNLEVVEEIPQEKRVRRNLEKAVMVPKKKKAERFRISLTKDEIEEDIMLITGAKSVINRPKKMKSKVVKRNIDTCFPGLMLCHINPNSYNLREKEG